jgi:hypothetical protein
VQRVAIGSSAGGAGGSCPRSTRASWNLTRRKVINASTSGSGDIKSVRLVGDSRIASIGHTPVITFECQPHALRCPGFPSGVYHFLHHTPCHGISVYHPLKYVITLRYDLCPAGHRCGWQATEGVLSVGCGFHLPLLGCPSRREPRASALGLRATRFLRGTGRAHLQMGHSQASKNTKGADSMSAPFAFALVLLVLIPEGNTDTK